MKFESGPSNYGIIGRSIALGSGIVLTASVGAALAEGRSPLSQNSTQSPIAVFDPATRSATPSAPDLAAESDGYILGAGDRVKVDFFNASEYTAEFPVLPNGTIQFPLVGAINV